jgi:hypothetical protein
MKTYILCWLALLPVACLQAQLADDFTDGNYTDDPVWTGTSNSWSVTAAGQLQSANTTANSTYYLSTEQALANAVQWAFTLRVQFNTSSANYVDVFLIASAPELMASATNGYFIRIGNTQDEISLYRKDGATVTKLIDGTDGVTNKSDNTLRIKVIRDADHNFSLYYDVTGTGNNYVTDGSITDDTYTTTTHFGFVIRQSTASFFQKHFIDNIAITAYAPDTAPPTIQSVRALSSTTLEVVFDEPLDAISAQRPTHYTIDNIGNPTAVLQDANQPALVHLVFPTPFTNGLTHTLSIAGVSDALGNAITSATATFSHYTPKRFDLVINEIMADPSPPVNLPNAEYIEIKNTSKQTINLKGWRFKTATATSSSFPSYELPADSFLIITTNAAVNSFPSHLRKVGLPSFPTLDNTGSMLTLLSNEGTIIHALAYSKQWYADSEKEEGGWSLEMIDPQNPCGGGANWKASNHTNGGTPGEVNSANGRNTDAVAPVLQLVYTTSPDTLVFVFDEPLDSLSAATVTNYTIDNSIQILSVTASAPLFNSIALKLSAPLQTGISYTVSATAIMDCKGNGAGVQHTSLTGLPEAPDSLDLVINELLFNPRTNGEDYIELYNRSNKILDASKLYLANRNGAGAIASPKQLTENALLLYPGQYLLITENKTILALHYHVKNPAAVLELASLPSYPDTEGTVVLLHQQKVLDEVHYADDWHFDLITDKEGIALERIDPEGPSQDAHNWHSAASTAGYGTPGYQNSQWQQVAPSAAQLTIATPVFSPDNDGHDDVALIQYNINEPGYVANLFLFDAKGVQVRHLVKNGTLGLKGSWTWDGLNEQKQRLPIGTYILYAEFFNLQGKKERFKKTVVLTRKN